jgi:rhodanese-related sulfurtransferase
MERVSTVSPERLQELGNPFVLDVRAKAEYVASHIPGAIRLHGGRVMWHLDELPHDRPIVVHCQTGSRSAVVASALRTAGFTMWSNWREATRATRTSKSGRSRRRASHATRGQGG